MLMALGPTPYSEIDLIHGPSLGVSSLVAGGLADPGIGKGDLGDADAPKCDLRLRRA
jgi:hypothetical protein